jgi:hypothetical protein
MSDDKPIRALAGRLEIGVSRVCTLCVHAERHAIDMALVVGEPCRTIASRYGTIGRMAVERHKARHLPVKRVQAEAGDLLSQVRDVQTSALRILLKAEQAGDLRTALGAISQARSSLELLATLTGELDERALINVLVAPEWLRIRAVLLTALAPCPGRKALQRWREPVVSLASDRAMALDLVVFSRAAGLEPDPWQAKMLRSRASRLLLNCSRQSGKYQQHRVPKRELVGTLIALYQGGRIKVAKNAPLAVTLHHELVNFKVKVALRTAHDSYEAWREGTHDDLVRSVAMACWYAEHIGGPMGV